MATTFPTRTEMTVLRILQEAPSGMSGADIVSRGVSEGSVYTLLARLDRKGFVKVSRVPSPYPGLCRSIYRLSAAGVKVLDLDQAMASENCDADCPEGLLTCIDQKVAARNRASAIGWLVRLPVQNVTMLIRLVSRILISFLPIRERLGPSVYDSGEYMSHLRHRVISAASNSISADAGQVKFEDVILRSDQSLQTIVDWEIDALNYLYLYEGHRRTTRVPRMSRVNWRYSRKQALESLEALKRALKKCAFEESAVGELRLFDNFQRSVPQSGAIDGDPIAPVLFGPRRLRCGVSLCPSGRNRLGDTCGEAQSIATATTVSEGQVRVVVLEDAGQTVRVPVNVGEERRAMAGALQPEAVPSVKAERKIPPAAGWPEFANETEIYLTPRVVGYFDNFMSLDSSIDANPDPAHGQIDALDDFLRSLVGPAAELSIASADMTLRSEQAAYTLAGASLEIAWDNDSDQQDRWIVTALTGNAEVRTDLLTQTVAEFSFGPLQSQDLWTSRETSYADLDRLDVDSSYEHGWTDNLVFVGGARYERVKFDYVGRQTTLISQNLNNRINSTLGEPIALDLGLIEGTTHGVVRPDMYSAQFGLAARTGHARSNNHDLFASAQLLLTYTPADAATATLRLDDSSLPITTLRMDAEEHRTAGPDIIVGYEFRAGERVRTGAHYRPTVYFPIQCNLEERRPEGQSWRQRGSGCLIRRVATKIGRLLRLDFPSCRFQPLASTM